MAGGQKYFGISAPNEPFILGTENAQPLVMGMLRVHQKAVRKMMMSMMPVASIALGGAIAACGSGATDSLLSGGSGGPGGENDPGAVANGPVANDTRETCGENYSPESVAIHRLNRAEYNNSVRDLLGDTTQPANAFPADDTGAGFDNISSILTTGNLLFERYEAAADSLVEAAWAKDAAGGTPAVRVCDPVAAASCARTIVEQFARKAWRRPATKEEVDRLITLVDVAKSQGDDASVGARLALKAILVSPNFIYRPEFTSAGALTPFELGARLSYFLWSSTPDETLLQLAESGELIKTEVVIAQVERMLNDPKAGAIVDNFAGQWLQTRKIADIAPDATAFPDFDAPLKQAMGDEMNLFFKAFLNEDRSALDFVDADFMFVNDRLAKHYGMSPVGSSSLVRVPAKAGERGGFLRQGGFLAFSSFATRTSAVRRGKWVMTSLLCEEPPPPPPNIAPLPEASGGTKTERQRLEAHRSNAACAGCHAVMDPIGLGFENYDAIGAWRSVEGGAPVDASGKLPDGKTFNGAAELSSIIKNDPRFAHCMSEKMLTYALGREIASADDKCAVDVITTHFQKEGYRLSALPQLIAQSPIFATRKVAQ